MFGDYWSDDLLEGYLCERIRAGEVFASFDENKLDALIVCEERKYHTIHIKTVWASNPRSLAKIMKAWYDKYQPPRTTMITSVKRNRFKHEKNYSYIKAFIRKYYE